MRRVSVWLALSLIGMATAALPVRAVTLDFSPVDVSATVGDLFQVEVRAAGLGDGTSPSLSVFDLELSFDSALLGFESVTFSGFLGDIPSFEAVVLADSLVFPGVLHLAESSLLEESAATCIFCTGPYLEELQGSAFSLATVSFRSLAAGSGALSLAVNSLGDGSGQPLPVDALGTANVTVRPSAAIPEPASVLLILGGAPLLRRFRRC